MQVFSILTSLALATFVVATPAPAPQTTGLPICEASGAACVVLLPELCCSGTCTAGTGILGGVLGVSELLLLFVTAYLLCIFHSDLRLRIIISL